MEYEDFAIKIEPKQGDVYPVIVLHSPAGEGRSLMILPFEPGQLGTVLCDLGRSVRGDPNKPTRHVAGVAPGAPAQDIGAQLFTALFSGSVRSLLDQSLGLIHGEEYGLRIKIHIDPEDPSLAVLASLPWEFLYRRETRDWLSLSKYTPIVRYLDVQRPHTPLALKLPLRILVVLSQPADTPALDLARERALIEASWAKVPGVEVEFLEGATLEALRDRLSHNIYHVLHYMGHGGFDEHTGRGVLLLEGGDAQAQPVDGPTLAILLRDVPSLRLVLLNACVTARLTRGEGLDPFAGVASSLVMAGIPAVVAMQFPISDAAAVAFANCFYRLLACGEAVDTAVVEGRRAILTSQAGTLEWGTPVLFMRTADGVVFRLAGRVRAEAEAQREAEERTRREAEALAEQQAAERMRQEEEAQARGAAEEQARRDAEAKAQDEAEERAVPVRVASMRRRLPTWVFIVSSTFVVAIVFVLVLTIVIPRGWPPDFRDPQVHLSLSPSTHTWEQITLKVDASDAGGGLAVIGIYVDGKLVKECSTSPCEYQGGPYKAGEHSVDVKALDRAGNDGTSSWTFTALAATPTPTPTPTPVPTQKPAATYSPGSKVTGLVRNQADGALEGIKVWLEQDPCSCVRPHKITTVDDGGRSTSMEVDDLTTLTNQNGQYTIGNVPPGQYCVCVDGDSVGEETSYEDKSAVGLTKSDAQDLSVPPFDLLRTNLEVEYWEDVGGGGHFSWNPYEGADLYRVRIIRSPGPRATEVYTDTTSSTSFYTPLGEGTYEMTVTALSTTGMPFALGHRRFDIEW